MIKGDHKIFRDQQKLQEMLSLRQQGWSLQKLAVRYGIDHTSILYWCKKYNCKPGQKVIREFSKCKVCGKPVNAIANKFCSQKCYSQFCTSKNEVLNEVLNEKIVEGINQGKSYMDYVRAENLKKAERFRKLKVVLGLS